VPVGSGLRDSVGRRRRGTAAAPAAGELRGRGERLAVELRGACGRWGEEATRAGGERTAAELRAGHR